MLRRRLSVPTLAFAALIALAGCGLGAGPAPKDIRLEVTRDFGARVVRNARAPRVRGQETVMSLLMRNTAVTTRYGGAFVQSIAGLSGGHEGGDPVDWFYYLNGVEAGRGAAEVNVRPGERIWWDLHDWSAAQDVPAVVGSFPEPFSSGIEGKRLPVRVECAQPAGSWCATALARLRGRGVPAALAAPSGAYSPHTLRMIVGPFAAIAADPAARALEQGPRASGVYARLASDGRTLTPLDARGRATRTLTGEIGLVAATRSGEAAPVWIVTGSDDAGVSRAADALDEASLAGHFALALDGAGAPVPLPDDRR